MNQAIDPSILDPDLPILCFSTTDWHETWGSRQQIMQRLSHRGHPILFIERQVGPEQLLRDPGLRRRKLIAWRSNNLRQFSKNLWIWQPPMLPPGRYYSSFLNQIGQKILANKVRNLSKKLNFSNPILWIFPPQSAPLLGQLRESISIYHCIDNFSGNQSGIKRRVMQSQENLLLQNVDLVFTHSEGLLSKYSRLTKRSIILVPSAADVSFFQSVTEIDPLVAEIPHPSIGLAGTLDGRLDIKLLENIVKNHPEWHLILIGQWHPERVNLAQVINNPNVHFMGFQPYEKLPALLNGIDVLLIPYKLDEMTIYISPIKLYEYLAIGKPIISVNLPEVRKFNRYLRIAENPQDFPDLIQEALEEDSFSQVIARRELARQHSWEARLATILPAIGETLKDKHKHAG